MKLVSANGRVVATSLESALSWISIHERRAQVSGDAALYTLEVNSPRTYAKLKAEMEDAGIKHTRVLLRSRSCVQILNTLMPEDLT